MNYLLKHLQIIAYFLASLILFQSCVIYQKQSIALEEIPDEDTQLLIKTIDDKIYELHWIEDKEDKIYSINNTKRYFIDTAIIQSIHHGKVLRTGIPFREMKHQVGFFSVKTISEKFKFIKIDVEGQYMIGYKKLNGPVYSIEIPKDQICSIRHIDIEASKRANGKLKVGIPVIGFGLLIGWIIYAVNNMEIEMLQ